MTTTPTAASRRSLVPFVIAAAITSAGCVYFTARAGLTDNILWAPSTPRRAVALGATLAPWAGILAVVLHRRHRHR